MEGDGDENSFCVAECEAVLDSGVEIPYSARTAAAEADTDEGGVTDEGGGATALPTAPPPLEVELMPKDEPNPKVSPKGLLKIERVKLRLHRLFLYISKITQGGSRKNSSNFLPKTQASLLITQ